MADTRRGCVFTRDDSDEVCWVNLADSEKHAAYQIAGHGKFGTFDSPTGIEMTADFGSAYVVDSGNARLVRLRLDVQHSGDAAVLEGTGLSSYDETAAPAYTATVEAATGSCAFTTLEDSGALARHCKLGNGSSVDSLALAPLTDRKSVV